jgi:hypothetical protein
MKSSTFVALKAILEADQPRTKQDTETLLRALGLTDGQNAKDEGDRIVSFTEAARRLACSKRSIHNFVKRGILSKVCFPGCTRARGFLASDIDALLRADEVA